MSLPVELRDEAEFEFDEAFDFYERRGRGLGIRFTYAVQRTFELISRRPLSKRVVKADVRRAAVTKFPYQVLPPTFRSN